MKTADRHIAWVSAAGITTAALIVADLLPLDTTRLLFEKGLVAAGTFVGAALAMNLSGRRLLIALPALAAPLLYGETGSIIVWTAGALMILATIRGDEGRAKSAFLTRRMLLRRVMDSNFPDLRSHRALVHGFAGATEELRPSVAPVASLPPSIALPMLSRLSLSTDSITRLTARKRMELLLTALREEADKPTPARDARHAAIRMRKAETLLLLSTWGSSDPDERRARLNEAAALAYVASDDYPGNDQYNTFAAGAAARIGELKAASRLHTRITNPRRAWQTARLIRLCSRLFVQRDIVPEAPARIRVKEIR